MTIISAEDYIKSLQNRNLVIYYKGEIIDDPVNHPVIRPSINAVAETYKLAQDNKELATVKSSISGKIINRFLHITEKSQDLVLQNKMQRKLGQITGSCFQRCVGMDAINSLHSVTFDIDEKYSTNYHQRFLNWLKDMQNNNFVIGGAMTDVKGDRSKGPHEQIDSDLYVNVVDQNEDGIFISGAKAHQTGCINSHWLLVMPTIRMSEKNKNYAIVGALPVDSDNIIYIYGRQSSDTRNIEEADVGNHYFAGQEALIIFEKVFIPWKYVFMYKEYEFASILVERFTNYHRRSYVCKSGVGDVLIGASSTIAEYNGVITASHIKDKLAEMTQLNELIYGLGLASSFQSYKLKSGVYMCDEMLANVCKYNVTKLPYEISRLAQDIAGGLLVTMPSEKDFKNSRTGPLLMKYLQGKIGVPTNERMKILRLIENLTLGRGAVGYLTESMHGAGSPQAQKINFLKLMETNLIQNYAKKLANVPITKKENLKSSGYFKRVFDTNFSD